MKLRLIAILYTVFLIVIFTIGIIKYNSDDIITSNITDIHYRVEEIQSSYINYENISSIENKYSCKILFIDNPQYSYYIWDSINKDCIIYDLTDKQSNIVGKIIIDRKEQAYSTARKSLWKSIFLFGIVIAVSGYVFLIVVYFSVIHPFIQLKNFASAVGKGNLDIPLPMHRQNFFGAFTTSFDLMREELKLAKQKEYEANQSKKELVAELSHDIKTPVSTIRANCELLSALTLDSFTKNKIEIINSKAQSIEKLIDNLFHATLEELQVLKVAPEETSSLTVMELIDKLTVYDDIKINNDIPEYLVWMDTLRFSQVLDNIIYNSYKYGMPPVEISFTNEVEGIVIKIADHGNGVSEEELPLLANKFYRGKNIDNKMGSGLGLFLSKTFMEQMKGEFTYYNDNGFVVELFLKRV